MPWPPRRSSITEVQLQREIEVLGLKLLRANAALRSKTLYAQRLEYLLHERSERIDELNGQLDRLRALNQRLGLENEVLAAMLAPSAVTAFG
jgi:septal ring factor EnvC (AmiA/AmiB activator)